MSDFLEKLKTAAEPRFTSPVMPRSFKNVPLHGADRVCSHLTCEAAMRSFFQYVVLLLVCAASATDFALAQSDPLPSWNDGTSKRAIADFVARVTREGGADFVTPAERIATFDNDGTLWSEQPIYFQFAFALDRVKALAQQHPEWKEKEPFASVLKGDLKGLAARGEKGLLEIMAATHTGMTTDEFERIGARTGWRLPGIRGSIGRTTSWSFSRCWSC